MELDDDELEATRKFYGVGRKKKKEPSHDTNFMLDRINGVEVKKKWRLIKLGLKGDNNE